MGGARSVNGREDTRIQNSSWKTLTKRPFAARKAP